MLTKNVAAAILTLIFIAPLAVACADAGDEASEPAPTAQTDTSDQPITGGDACNSAQVTQFLGQEASEETRAAVLAAIAPVENVRFVGPQDAMTMDHLPDRLTVELDEAGIITTASCG